MSKRKIIRRFRAGADEGISIVDENDEKYIHIDLNNNTHLLELINMVCYDMNIDDIIKLRDILKSNDYQNIIASPDKQDISKIKDMISKLAPYSQLQNVSSNIELLNGIIEFSNEQESDDIVDTKEIERQEELQKQAIHEAEIQMKMDKENATNETSSSLSSVLDDDEKAQLKLLEEANKMEDEASSTTGETLDDDEKAQLELLKKADNMIADEASSTTGETLDAAELNKTIEETNDLMEEVKNFSDSEEQAIKRDENIQRDIEEEAKLEKIFNMNLQKIYETHPILYQVIVRGTYEPVFRLPLLRAITIIQNKEDRNSLIDKLEYKILNNMNMTNELKKLISDLELIKKSELDKLKYGGKIKFNRKRKSSKKKSSKRKSSK
jgi:hypothetical protein